MGFWDRQLDKVMNDVIRWGRLELRLADGTVLRHGGDQGPEVRVSTDDPDLARKVLINPDLAVGEAYMDGRIEIERDDLHTLLGLLLENRKRGADATVIRVNHLIRRLGRRLAQNNPMGRAQANVAHHYDLSHDLYRLFLDEDLQYSCAYFRDPTDTLEQAQRQKKQHIAAKLCLKPGQHVLDIGCGWGGLALSLARDFDVRVTGVTLSREQHRHAVARAEQAGLEGRVAFHLADYRTLRGPFDRVVSVGMFEHVGVPHYREYFRHIRDFLTEDGIALVHTIGRADPPGTTSPWIHKYIFPGGYAPALSEMMRAVEKERLWTCDIEILRLHYAWTLRHWYRRFVDNQARAESLYDPRFCRMWRFYLAASEVTFSHSTQSVYQLQLARRPDAVPVTRDYIYRGP